MYVLLIGSQCQEISIVKLCFHWWQHKTKRVERENVQNLSKVQCCKDSVVLFQVKVKCTDLRTKDKNELLKQVVELKTELTTLRVAKVTGGAASKLSKMYVCISCNPCQRGKF